MLGNAPRIDITENGRTGSITYHEGTGTLSFYWEFGGGDVVAIVQVSDMAAWNDPAHWTAPKKSAVLRYVAEEVIKRKAPSCRAEIDEAAGQILLKEGVGQAAPSTAQPIKQFSPRTYRSLRTKLALVVLTFSVSVAAVLWLAQVLLQGGSGKGAPLGLAVRTDAHIAMLMRTQEASMPKVDGRGGNDTYDIGLLLVPLDGSAPKLIPIADGIELNNYGLSNVLGSDGRTLWFDVGGLGGVDLRTYELLAPTAIPKEPPADLQGALAWPFPLRPEAFLCAGFFTGPNEWLGVHSTAEVEGRFKPKSWLRRAESADDGKELRHLYRGVLDRDTSDDHHQILSMSPIASTELPSTDFLNAAFLRMDDTSEPVRVRDPDGALMIYTSVPGLKGTLMVARVDTDGNIRWKVDTGIDRFNLEQVLPGTNSMAFIGPRTMVPDQLTEPLLVIVDNSTGAITTHSLWQ